MGIEMAACAVQSSPYCKPVFAQAHCLWDKVGHFAWGMLLSKNTVVACHVAVCLQSFTATTPRRKGLL
jgi:hypothetical protein